ncbi:hypothetical protein Daura_17290 [Dactylosporangium aurantiacum]|uniref:Uncharacterized protein n=1 Tax=Dactylosporangium aurantiacum TaxID=35754 RepID=A0A9Q9IKD2_9ACTN|nr:hypothetical protein [Dactylosporangium aurantiacum]MDG6103262.1 hypothetical protein [Dactylosporangium aurantiacum]UWZ57764.1 hypothetical protein Daura_17290 [Dactylosporangium aurantiacum]
MTDVDEEQDHLVRLLSPTVHVPSAAQAAGDELLRDILRTERPSPWRRRLLVAVPAVAGLAAAAVAVSALLPTSTPVGPAPAGAALAFTEDAGYLIVTIKDPAADPQRYRDELARHGLNIKIELVPANPQDVGKVVHEEVGDTGGGPTLEAIEDPGRCTANGACQVGFKVPLNFTSYAVVAFGRTPLPGEFVEGGSDQQNADADALVGKRVSEARRLLVAQGRTAEYRVGWDSLAATEAQVPGDWIVYDTAPVSNTVVVLWVSPDGKAPDKPRPSPSGQVVAPSVKAG